VNLYEFVNNAPITSIDALGLKRLDNALVAFISGTRGNWLPEPKGKDNAPLAWLGSLYDLWNGNWLFKTNERNFGEFNWSTANPNAKLVTVVSIESDQIGKMPSGGVLFATSGNGTSIRREVSSGKIEGPRRAELSPNEVQIKIENCRKTVVSVNVGGAYPFAPVSDPIRYEAKFTFEKIDGGAVKVTIEGRRTTFPDYETYIDRNAVDKWPAPDAGPSRRNLGERNMTQTFSSSKTIN
jgi:hypothetical protein